MRERPAARLGVGRYPYPSLMAKSVLAVLFPRVVVELFNPVGI
ncbi:MAG: hypothetical protein AB1609_13425 [Bacillota bacterium]